MWRARYKERLPQTLQNLRNLVPAAGSEPHRLQWVEAGPYLSELCRRRWIWPFRTTMRTTLNYPHPRFSSSRLKMRRFCVQLKIPSLLYSRPKPDCWISVLCRRSALPSSHDRQKSRASYMRMPLQRARWAERAIFSFVKRVVVHATAGSGCYYFLFAPVCHCYSLTIIEQNFLPPDCWPRRIWILLASCPVFPNLR